MQERPAGFPADVTAMPILPAATVTLSPTPVPTRTPRPTAGPGLTDLLLTPRAAAETGDTAAAQEGYLGIASLYPESAAPFLALADLALQAGDRARALAYTEDAIRAAPDDPAPLRRLTVLLDDSVDDDRLIEAYGTLIELEPSDVALPLAQALVLARNGQARAAIDALESAHELDSTTAYGWRNAAGEAARVRDYHGAVTIASAGLRMYPADSALLLARALAYLSLQDADRAQIDLNALLGYEPWNAEAAYWYGRALQEQGRAAEAVVVFQRASDLALNTGPGGVEAGITALVEAAVTLAEIDPQGAYALLAEGVVEYGSLDPLLLGYARTDLFVGDHDLALARLDGLVQAGYSPALLWRGITRRDAGEEAAAREDLEAYLVLVPSGPDAEAAYRLLDAE